MEGMEEAAKPAGGGPQEPRIGSRTASCVDVTSAMERNGTEPQTNNGHFSRPWPCPQEDRTSPMAPQPLRSWGPSVLESKVRALKENMTTGKQGASPCFTTHEQPSPKKPKCRQVKVGGAKMRLPDAMVVPLAQNLTEGQLDNSVHEEKPAGSADPGPPRSPTPGLECCNGRKPWTPETVWALPDHERDLLLCTSLEQSPTHRVTPGRPRGPGPCNKSPQVPSLRKGRSYPLQDDPGTGGDLDSLSLTSEENFVPRPALPGGLWRAGDVGALGPAGSALPLSERVERNRLLLQEMLIVGGQASPKVRIPAWTPSWDRAVPERSSGDLDWDSGISLQDSEQNRTFGPKPEPVQRSPRHEEAKHLLQRARMKARTRPLRASHDIMPTIDQGSRDGGRSPALDGRMPFAYRDNLHNGSTSDSSSGESSSGQWPKRGPTPSHVRFEDESAHDAESRYLERLQQRQRQAWNPALQMADQGPLRSKPELADYIAGALQHRDAGKGALHRLVGHMNRRALPEPPPIRGSERTCRACGSCIEDRSPALGKAAPDPRDLQECEAASGLERVLAEPLSSRGLSAPLRLLPAEQGLRTERIRETHIGDSVRPEEVDSALDSTDTSDSCRTNSEEAGTSQPSRARGPSRGSNLRMRGSKPRGGHRWSGKAEMESPGIPGDLHYLPGIDLVEVSDEVKEGKGHMPESTLFLRGDPCSKPRVQESERGWLGTQRQSQPGPGNHPAHPVDSWALCRTACTVASFEKPGKQDQVIESHESLETVPLHAETTALHQAQQPMAFSPPEVWVPTPPSSRKTTSRGSHRKAPRRPSVGTISSTGITFSLALEEPESSREPEGGLQRTESSSKGHLSSRALPGLSAGPGLPSATPSDRNKKTSGSVATLGLKKFLLALGQGTRPRLGKSRSYSVEQLQPPEPGLASHTSTPKVKRAPSLQSLRLVSPPHQHRKAASFQNLHSLLSGKMDRSSLYLVEEPGDHRLAKGLPRRALSVEDVGAPSLARTVGRVVEVFPDGTSQLQLQRSPDGTFGFCVASGNGRRDSGFYVQEMSDVSTAKLYSGLLGVGDEILEVNGAKVAGLGLAHIRELLAHAESLSLRVLRQRPVPR
ncbi:uncharacterized protein KIAA1614 homolog isoform 2-T2 [Rhynchonycteris naso]